MPPNVTFLGRRLAPGSCRQLHKTSMKKHVSNFGKRMTGSRRYKSTVADGPLSSGSTYRNLLDAWAKSGNRVAGMTNKLLNALSKKDVAPKPKAKIEPPKLSTEARNALHVWMNSDCPESSPEGKRLEELAKEVRDSKPTTAMYTYLLNGLAHANNNDQAGAKALKLLKEMHAKGIPPTAESYAFAVDAWAQPGSCDAGVMSQTLLTEMSHCGIQPTAETYKACMNAWAKSGAFEAGEMAEQLLREMQAKGMEPTTETYTIVLDAWARAGVADGYKTEKNKEVEQID